MQNSERLQKVINTLAAKCITLKNELLFLKKTLLNDLEMLQKHMGGSVHEVGVKAKELVFKA